MPGYLHKVPLGQSYASLRNLISFFELKCFLFFNSATTTYFPTGLRELTGGLPRLRSRILDLAARTDQSLSHKLDQVRSDHDHTDQAQRVYRQDQRCIRL